MLANSRFYTRFGLGGEAGINEYNPLRDITLAGDISYFKSQEFNLFFGAELKDLDIKYNSRFNDETLFDSRTAPSQLAFYSKVKWKPNKRFIIEPGIRGCTGTLLGGTKLCSKNAIAVKPIKGKKTWPSSKTGIFDKRLAISGLVFFKSVQTAPGISLT